MFDCEGNLSCEQIEISDQDFTFVPCVLTGHTVHILHEYKLSIGISRASIILTHTKVSNIAPVVIRK